MLCCNPEIYVRVKKSIKIVKSVSKPRNQSKKMHKLRKYAGLRDLRNSTKMYFLNHFLDISITKECYLLDIRVLFLWMKDTLYDTLQGHGHIGWCCDVMEFPVPSRKASENALLTMSSAQNVYKKKSELGNSEIFNFIVILLITKDKQSVFSWNFLLPM